jgi:hypothetical protein
MTQFSIQWILSLNRLSQNWGPLQEDIEQGAVSKWRDRIEMIYSKRYPTHEFVLLALPHGLNHHDNNLLVIRRTE